MKTTNPLFPSPLPSIPSPFLSFSLLYLWTLKGKEKKSDFTVLKYMNQNQVLDLTPKQLQDHKMGWYSRVEIYFLLCHPLCGAYFEMSYISHLSYKDGKYL